MANQIRMTPDTMRTRAGQTDKQAEAMQNLINAMDRLLTTLKGEWEGDAMRGYEDRYNKIKPSYALVDKYNWYRTKINSGVYTQEDMQQCQLYFRMAKAAKLEEYKSIKVTLEDAVNSGGAIFSSSEDKQYTRDILSELDGEIERLERLTL